MRLVTGLLLCAGLYAQDATFVTLTPHGVPKVHEGAGRARRRLSPCSTFKIPNSLIGLETGITPTPEHVFKFDEKKHRTAFWIDAWSKDLDLRTAFKLSAVWYYRELAAKVGPGTMKAFVDRFGYGNRDTTGGDAPFWLRSTLQISAVEQVEFLDRLFRNEFGLTPRHVAAVESFMLQDKQEGRELYYKTGACTDVQAGPEVWMVGFVRSGEQRTYFAMNVGAPSLDEILPKRIELALERLRRAGLWR
ncbi:MAG: class D beta-lactamase [Bryobacterales bacterium]|nr:class D beta-lactamase [Bryobacterales bacterium]